MRKLLYIVRDLKVDVFGFPIVVDNHNFVLCYWCDVVNSLDLLFVKHSEDYVFYRIGAFDIICGVLHAEDQPIHIAFVEEVFRHA